jgi:antitoxin HicB
VRYQEIEQLLVAEEGFRAEVPDLAGCFTAGETEEEALEHLRDAMAGWFEVALVRGMPIPEPRAGDEYSGRVLVRLPKSMHRQLAERAKAEGVSQNQLAVTLLAMGLGRIAAREPAGGGTAPPSMGHAAIPTMPFGRLGPT